MRKLNNKGQTLVEYVLIISLITVVAIAAVKLLGGHLKDKITEVSCEITGKAYVEGIILDIQKKYSGREAAVNAGLAILKLASDAGIKLNYEHAGTAGTYPYVRTSSVATGVDCNPYVSWGLDKGVDGGFQWRPVGSFKSVGTTIPYEEWYRAQPGDVVVSDGHVGIMVAIDTGYDGNGALPLALRNELQITLQPAGPVIGLQIIGLLGMHALMLTCRFGLNLFFEQGFQNDGPHSGRFPTEVLVDGIGQARTAYNERIAQGQPCKRNFQMIHSLLLF